MKIEKIIVGKLKTNCYSFEYQNQTIVIDPGAESPKIIAELKKQNLKPNLLLATHGHFDHLSAVREIKKHFPQSRFFLSQSDLPVVGKTGLIAPLFGYQPLASPPKPDDFLENFSLPNLTIISTPGHSPGGVCFLFQLPGQTPILFSGDTLFEGFVGRYDFPLGNKQALKNSLKKLTKLPPQTKVYPGHGKEFILSKAFEFLPKLLREWSQSGKP